MKRIDKARRLFYVIAAIAVIGITSCTTVNEFDTVDLYGARIVGRLAVPPEPEVDISYNLYFNPKNPVETIISVGTNLAKAQAAERAETVMLDALKSVDLPNRVFDESYRRCVQALGAKAVEDDVRVGTRPEYLFEIDIDSYGIEASSHSGEVSFSISLMVTIRDDRDYDLIWRRSIHIEERAHPGLFGVPSEVGSVLSVAALINLSEEQMRTGFERLVDLASVDVARKLEDDIHRARSMASKR